MPILVSKKFDRGKANVVAKQLGKQEELASDPFPGSSPTSPIGRDLAHLAI